MRRVAAVALVLALAGCSGASGSGASGSGSSGSGSSSAAASAGSSDAAAARATALPKASVPAAPADSSPAGASPVEPAATQEKAGVAVTTAPPAKTVTDDLLGHRIEVVDVVRGLTSPAAPGEEVLLVDFAVTPGAAQPSVGAGTFALDGGTSVTESVQALLAQKGRTALPARVTAASRGTLAFAVAPGAHPSVLQYVRPPFVSDKGRIYGDRAFLLRLP